MNKVALRKETRIEETLDLISGTYVRGSVVYATTKDALGKLSLIELNALYVMMGTTIDV